MTLPSPTPPDHRLSFGENIPPGATPMRCPSGGLHAWNFARSTSGLGWYECAHCGCTLTKPTLKRLTDRRFDQS